MPNQYTKLTRANIITKTTRKRNPVNSMAQLAREFGYNTTYRRHEDQFGREGLTDTAAPAHFRARVRALVGDVTYNRIRQQQHVNKCFS